MAVTLVAILLAALVFAGVRVEMQRHPPVNGFVFDAVSFGLGVAVLVLFPALLASLS